MGPRRTLPEIPVPTRGGVAPVAAGTPSALQSMVGASVVSALREPSTAACHGTQDCAFAARTADAGDADAAGTPNSTPRATAARSERIDSSIAHPTARTRARDGAGSGRPRRCSFLQRSDQGVSLLIRVLQLASEVRVASQLPNPAVLGGLG